MFLICAVHLMNFGGMLQNATGTALLFQRLVYSFFTISVNVFVIISGYFLVKSKFKWSKVLKLWLEVFFYSLVLFIIKCSFFNLNFTFKVLWRSCTPILHNSYWFFTAYFLVYLFSPFLSKMINACNKKEAWLLVFGILIICYLCNIYEIADIVRLNYGYSFIWFIFLFVIGASLRLYPTKIKRIFCFIVFIACILAVWGMFYLKNNNQITKFIYNPPEYFSLLVVIASIAIFLLFKDIKTNNKILNKSVCYISSCTFGVYLFHCSIIEPELFFNLLKIQNHYYSAFSPLWLLLFAGAIFVMGVVADTLRKLFCTLFIYICKKVKTKKRNKN